MKSFFIALLLSALFVSAGRTQSYSIEWFTIDSGGGMSTGSVYAVSGTIGQPDAGGEMTNGKYSLLGGFWWSLYTVQTEGAPVLSIARTSTNTVMVFWSSISSGWSLQQNTGLVSTNWTAVPETITDNGTSKFIIVSPAAGNRFYRLVHP